MLALATFVGVHFSLVLLYVLPSNPLSDAAQPLLVAYIRPVFTQNWRLFAPEPPTRDGGVLVRGTYVVGDEERTTAWLSLTDPFVQAVQHNRVSRLGLMRTTVYEAMFSVLNDPDFNNPDDAMRQRAFETWTDVQRQPAGLVVLEAAGSVALRSAYAGVDFQAVQVAITLHTFPPFDDRSAPDSDGPVSMWEFPAVPYQQVSQ